MKGNLWVIFFIVVLLLSIGFLFIFYSDMVRNYYFKNFNQGVDKVGFFASWLDKYPNPWFFKVFGFLIWIFAIAIIFLIFGKRR